MHVHINKNTHTNVHVLLYNQRLTGDTHVCRGKNQGMKIIKATHTVETHTTMYKQSVSARLLLCQKFAVQIGPLRTFTKMKTWTKERGRREEKRKSLDWGWELTSSSLCVYTTCVCIFKGQTALIRDVMSECMCVYILQVCMSMCVRRLLWTHVRVFVNFELRTSFSDKHILLWFIYLLSPLTQ